MKKILFISNISYKINLFSLASICAARRMGWVFHHASNWSGARPGQIEKEQEDHGITIHHVPITRSPFSGSNYAAYRQLTELLQKEKIDCIHCNTPSGGILGRLAGRKCKVGRVIYQVHGFHFYKGAPALNWLLYYPVERWLARYTDALITINQEDFDLARRKMRLRGNGKVYYVPGVGIETSRFRMEPAVRGRKRQELDLSDGDIMLVSTGELNKNKNHTVIISALGRLGNRRIHYFLCGLGDQEQALRRQAEKAGVAQQVHFLGYRQDVEELLQAADVFVMPSYREGLSRSIMEAMASGLPCVVSGIRGNVDLIQDGEGGFLCPPSDADGFAGAIGRLADSKELREKMSRYNLEKIRQYDTAVVERRMRDIYAEVFGKTEE